MGTAATTEMESPGITVVRDRDIMTMSEALGIGRSVVGRDSATLRGKIDVVSIGFQQIGTTGRHPTSHSHDFTRLLLRTSPGKREPTC